MGRIQSSIGLITGIPIADTVEQLIAISARPRDLLAARTNALTQEQVAVTELTALTIGVQFAARKLSESSLFEQTTSTSSDPSLLSVNTSGSPPIGSFQYTPVRKAQAHQLISSGFAADDQPIGAGTLKFRFGGFVDAAKGLDQLNGSLGVQRGQIRITDRSGASALVDLRFAKTVDDVIDAVNTQTEINVTLETDGDRFKIIDNTGQTISNLKVQDVGVGTTAADLGLGSIDVSLNEASGQDVLALHGSLSLNQLNDGKGIKFGPLDDLVINLRDSTSVNIDLTSGGVPTTFGELIERIDSASADLSAQISASGDAIELTDSSGGGGNFSVTSGTGSTVAEDLGISTSVAADTITSRRLRSGLKSSLLTSLGGGAGLGELGQLDIADRAGQSATVDLSSAQSLQDVVHLINAAPTVNVSARINNARNGIQLVDNSLGSGNLVVANGADGKTTADKLRVAIDDAVSSVNSGSLDLQVISENTTLASLNHGKGVQEGSFTIADTDGATGAVNLGILQPTTVGEVIDAINALGIGVVAEINTEGDGIRLRDTAFGTAQLTVTDAGGGTAAADLKLAGTSTKVDLSGTETEVIDGTTTLQVTIGPEDTLTDLIDNINALGADVAASAVNDGSGATPHRLALVSQIEGSAGELLVDTSATGFQFQQLAAAQDALLVVGSTDSLGAGVLVSSSSNEFDHVLSGASLTIQGTSTDPVTVTVETTDSDLTSQVQLFVDQYNSLRDKLDELTFFNETDNTIGILFGSNETLRIENGLTRLITDRFIGAGSVRSLEELGLSLDDQGKLVYDKQKLQDRFAVDPDAVRDFFATETHGMAAKFDELIETMAGEGNSLLVSRAASLQNKVDDNNQRIAFLNERLDRERTRLLTEFFRMEQVIGQLQSNLSVISSLQSIAPLSLAGSSGST